MRAMMQAMLAAPGIIGARQAALVLAAAWWHSSSASGWVAFTQSVGVAYIQATGIQPEANAVEAAAGAGVMAN